MIVNPVCHWASSGEPPLLVYAPGMPAADVIGNQWGVGDQLPQEQPFYDTSAEMVAAGLPAPTHILTFQESVQGSNIDEPVSGASYDLVDASGTTSPHYYCPARGLWVNGTIDGSQRKAIEFYQTTHNHRLRAQTTGVYNFGSSSWAIFFIFRANYPYPYATSNIVAKTSTFINGPGWYVRPGYFLVEDQNNHLVSQTAANNDAYTGSGWHYHLAWVDRTNALMNLDTDLYAPTPKSIATFDSSTDANGYFGFGYTPGPQYTASAAFQVAYACIWTGANAETMIAAGTRAANLRKLFSADQNYNNAPIDAEPNRSGLYTANIMTVIGEDPTIGTLTAGWGGNSGASPAQGNQKPLKYDPKISRSNKLCIAGSEWLSNHAPSSELDGGWTQVSATIESPITVGWNTNAGTMPDGYRGTLYRVRTDGGGGHIRSGNIAVTGGTFWRASMFVQRAYPEVTDVPGATIRLYDVTNSAWLTGATVTATEKWQEVAVEQVIPATCVSMRLYVYPGTYSVTRYVNVCYVTLTGDKAREGSPPGPVLKKPVGGNPYAYPVQCELNYAAGTYCKGTQGEVEAVFALNSNFNKDFTVLCNIKRASGNIDRRYMYVLAAAAGSPYNGQPRLGATFYDSAGAVISGAGVGPINVPAPYDGEHVAVMRWNSAGLPSGNTCEISIDGGAPTGVANAFVGTDTTTKIIYGGRDDILVSSNASSCSLSSVRIWENPR